MTDKYHVQIAEDPELPAAAADYLADRDIPNGKMAVQVPAVIAETVDRADDGRVELLLDHPEEPYYVRGRREAADDGIRRGSGGDTFHHYNTDCYTVVDPITHAESKDNGHMDWNADVMATLADLAEHPDSTFAYDAVTEGDGDFYIGDTPERRLAGTSIHNTKTDNGTPVRVNRMCIYPSQVDTPEMTELLQNDEERYEQVLDDDADNFYSQVQHTGVSLADAVKDDEYTAVEATAYVSDDSWQDAIALQQYDGSDDRGICGITPV